MVTKAACSQEVGSCPSLPWIVVSYFALPELRIRVPMAKPFIWQLVAVDPIGKFSPFQALVALYPVLIRALPKDMQRQVEKIIQITWFIKKRVSAVRKRFEVVP